MSFKNVLMFFAALTPLTLAACGPGWVVQPYKGAPYNGRGVDDDDRTAGYGVEYVRANMMPSKGADTTVVTPPPAPPTPIPVPVQTAEPLYNKAQQK